LKTVGDREELFGDERKIIHQEITVIDGFALEEEFEDSFPTLVLWKLIEVAPFAREFK